MLYHCTTESTESIDCSLTVLTQVLSMSHMSCQGHTCLIKVTHVLSRSHMSYQGHTYLVKVIHVLSRSYMSCQGHTWLAKLTQVLSMSHMSCQGYTCLINVTHVLSRSHISCQGHRSFSRSYNTVKILQLSKWHRCCNWNTYLCVLRSVPDMTRRWMIVMTVSSITCRWSHIVLAHGSEAL